MPIAGFDECFIEWSRDAPHSHRRPPARDSTPPVLDLKPVPACSLESLDWVRVQQETTSYAARLSIAVPDQVDRTWLVARLEESNLVTTHDGAVVPTQAGVLLFSSGAPVRVDIEREGLRETVTGNVLVVLERSLSVLADMNEPFRLKGPTSLTAYAYPPARNQRARRQRTCSP